MVSRNDCGSSRLSRARVRSLNGWGVREPTYVGSEVMAHRYDKLIQVTPDDERPCALNVSGQWFGTSCDWSTAINEWLWDAPDTDIEFSPLMDDREDLA